MGDMRQHTARAVSSGVSSAARLVARTPLAPAIRRSGLVPSNPKNLPYLVASKVGGETGKIVSFEDYEIRFWVSDPTERRSVSEHYAPRVGEYSVLRDMLSEMRSDDVFVDIGAYIGLQTCLFGQVADRVISYEPHPTNFRHLKRNICLNELAVEPRNLAVSDVTGETEYYVTRSEGTDTGGRIRDDSACSRNSIRVAVTTLSAEIPENHPVPSILKVDAEGEELAVLSDFAEIEESSECRLVYCEVHPSRLRTRGATEEMVEEKLASMGFDVSRFRDVHGNGEAYILKAKR